MSSTYAQGTARRNTQASLSNQSSEDLTLTASQPVTVRIELDHCPCGSEHNRAGSYVDTDFGR